ncbi:hypothetical protein [Novacetimonas hansenii]|uniref:hypothetical protein n=1 Tax=Novacetimonas hansenii TaxID=436 RepID=UPI00248F0138|nr:hypothetical protein [Novacetimonas hansenii]
MIYILLWVAGLIATQAYIISLDNGRSTSFAIVLFGPMTFPVMWMIYAIRMEIQRWNYSAYLGMKIKERRAARYRTGDKA